ncbi:hypothetical protein N0V85_002996 [Neurospora sp. IMI 360204]|nr:hypothetical protein N0V85_002996 [Neurospora sp. IMI 360204]
MIVFSSPPSTIPNSKLTTSLRRSFYHLSKTHHPDHNPSDPHASHRFMRISEAYSILSHADKRARYDHDVLRLHLRARAHGSHHSSSVGPAGGRPASGLSKRRSTAQGAPPPSFFKQGGYGEQKAKRERAEGWYTQGSYAGQAGGEFGFGGFGGSQTGTGAGQTGTTGGTTGSGQSQKQEWSQAFNPASAPHFDSQQHTRTHDKLWENLKKSHARRNEQATREPQYQQQYQQQQWWYQQKQEQERQQQWGESKKVLPEVQQGHVASFLAVTVVLLVSSFGPYWLFGGWARTGGKSSGGGGGGGGSKKQAAA